jgi:uncharacterized protein YndB with AHSA1/START domain
MTITGTLKVTTPNDREIVMTRVFDAPRGLVWDAMTRPDLLKRWLFGPPGWSMTACENSLDAGGSFRWVWGSPDGKQMVMHGSILEVVPLERIVRTESFDFGCDAKEEQQLATLVLSEHNGGGPGGNSEAAQTAFSLTLRYPSKEARDASMAFGMEHRMAMSYDGLEKLLATLRSKKGQIDAA